MLLTAVDRRGPHPPALGGGQSRLMASSHVATSGDFLVAAGNGSRFLSQEAHMARLRTLAGPAPRSRRVNIEVMRRAADDLHWQFGSLAEEVVTLRHSLAQAEAENAELRAELAAAVTLFNDAQRLVSAGEPAKRGRARAANGTTAARPLVTGRMRPRAASSRGEGATRASRLARNGRATPESVTPAVVRAVIGKLGSATAGEIAAQVSTAGAPVSGRAIRHIAKGAGAVMRRGDDGQMLYSLTQ